MLFPTPPPLQKGTDSTIKGKQLKNYIEQKNQNILITDFTQRFKDPIVTWTEFD